MGDEKKGSGYRLCENPNGVVAQERLDVEFGQGERIVESIARPDAEEFFKPTVKKMLEGKVCATCINCPFMSTRFQVYKDQREMTVIANGAAKCGKIVRGLKTPNYITPFCPDAYHTVKKKWASEPFKFGSFLKHYNGQIEIETAGEEILELHDQPVNLELQNNKTARELKAEWVGRVRQIRLEYHVSAEEAEKHEDERIEFEKDQFFGSFPERLASTVLTSSSMTMLNEAGEAVVKMGYLDEKPFYSYEKQADPNLDVPDSPEAGTW